MSEQVTPPNAPRSWKRPLPRSVTSRPSWAPDATPARRPAKRRAALFKEMSFMPALKNFASSPAKRRGDFQKRQKLRLFLCACILPAAALLVYIVLIPRSRCSGMSLYNQTAMSVPAPCRAGKLSVPSSGRILSPGVFQHLQAHAGVPLVTLALALVMAVIITQSRLKEKKFYRVVMFLPSILSTTVIGMLWTFLSIIPTWACSTICLKAGPRLLDPRLAGRPQGGAAGGGHCSGVDQRGLLHGHVYCRHRQYLP